VARVRLTARETARYNALVAEGVCHSTAVVQAVLETPQTELRQRRHVSAVNTFADGLRARRAPQRLQHCRLRRSRTPRTRRVRTTRTSHGPPDREADDPHDL